MDWFNVFKNKPTEQEMNSLTNIKGYAYDVNGGGLVGLPNVGMAKEVAAAAMWAERNQNKPFRATLRNLGLSKETKEAATDINFLGVPIVIYGFSHNSPLRGFNEFFRLQGTIPEQGIMLSGHCKYYLNELGINMSQNPSGWPDEYYQAVLGPYPSAIEQYEKKLEEDVNRKNKPGLFSRFRRK
tara:strand:- start:3043 stop:3594 length:552 start_codon:yes stop_codon:yes gene_type:complete